MNKILRIILTIAAILFIGVAYANKEGTTEQKEEVLDVTIYSGYVVTTTNLGQTVDNYEEKEIKVNPPKKKVSAVNPVVTQSWQSEADAQPEFSTWEVQELIRKYAGIYGVDETRALNISGCESGYRAKVKNRSSSAAGPFQQLAGYRPARANRYGWSGYSRFHAEANVAVSIQMLANEGGSHWNESKYCRNK